MSYTFTPLPNIQLSDGNGRPYAGGLIYTFEAGSTTSKTTYNEDDSANTNPVVLDSEGRAVIKLDVGKYRMVFTDGEGATIFDSGTIEGVTIWDIDDVGSGVQGINTVANYSELKAIPIATIESGAIAFVQNPSGTYIWDASNSSYSDGGVVIAPTDVVTSGRWVRVTDGTGVNPRWWGAAGDGLTNDTAEFISARTYATTNGCQIVLDSGTFYLATNPGLTTTGPQVVMNAAILKWSGYALNINPVISISDTNRHFNYSPGADNPVFPASAEIKNRWLDGSTSGWLQHTLALQSDMTSALADISTLQGDVSDIYPTRNGSFTATFPTSKTLTIYYWQYPDNTIKLTWNAITGLVTGVGHAASGTPVPLDIQPSGDRYIPCFLVGISCGLVSGFLFISGGGLIFASVGATNQTEDIESATVWYKLT